MGDDTLAPEPVLKIEITGDILGTTTEDGKKVTVIVRNPTLKVKEIT